MDISIRQFRRDDIEFALARTAREGWDATTELFENVLALDPAGGFVAELEGRQVGMLTTVCHARSAWLGNLIVLPEYRRQGLGERLMRGAMTYLSGRGFRTLRLEADPPGIKIYRRLGFIDEFESLRFRLPPRDGGDSGPTERITLDDLPAVAEFDAQYFGDRRERLLKLLLQQASGIYRLSGGSGPRGYAFVMPSTAGVRLGPFVAVDRSAAETLLRAVMAEWANATVIVGVSALNRAAIDLFEFHGFQRTPSSLRMVYGKGETGESHGNIYAIANGAVG